MPKECFYKLKAEKQERILLAAEEELKSVPFDKISINKIIQKAGIPRGSFYQYFDDKLDIMAFVIRNHASELYMFTYEVLNSTDHNIFMAFSAVLRFIVAGYEKNSEIGFKNVFPNLKMSEYNTIFPLPLMELISICCTDDSYSEELSAIVSSPVYNGASREDILSTIDILIAVLQCTLSQLDDYKGSREEYIAGFEHKLNIISRGLTGKEWSYV